MSAGHASASPDSVFHGRRRGRRLRAGRWNLVQTLLPALRVTLPTSQGTLDPRRCFVPSDTAVWMEIGFGAGELLEALALRHPEIGFIGCEPYVNGVASLTARVDYDRLTNVRIFDDDARLLLPALASASIDAVIAWFPDPWPKARHHRRRLIAPAVLDELARVLGDAGKVYFASDHDAYVRWTLDHVLAHEAFAWEARRPADWRERPADWPLTRYERKALAAGTACTYLRFRRRPRARRADDFANSGSGRE